MRASYSSSSSFWRLPRWMENCGQRYPAAIPLGSRQISEPNLLKYPSSAVAMPVDASQSPNPNIVSTRTPCGSKFSPTPSCWTRGTDSKTSHSIPALARHRAAVRPPGPAPAISTFIGPLILWDSDSGVIAVKTLRFSCSRARFYISESASIQISASAGVRPLAVDDYFASALGQAPAASPVAPNRLFSDTLSSEREFIG